MPRIEDTRLLQLVQAVAARPDDVARGDPVLSQPTMVRRAREGRAGREEDMSQGNLRHHHCSCYVGGRSSRGSSPSSGTTRRRRGAARRPAAAAIRVRETTQKGRFASLQSHKQCRRCGPVACRGKCRDCPRAVGASRKSAFHTRPGKVTVHTLRTQVSTAKSEPPRRAGPAIAYSRRPLRRSSPPQNTTRRGSAAAAPLDISRASPVER
jgi:hypothetical protein